MFQIFIYLIMIVVYQEIAIKAELHESHLF